MFKAPTGIHTVPIPEGTIWDLPQKGNYVALTVDDGTDTRVVKAYAELATRTGLRLTFFVNGYMESWTEHAAILRPLLENGQVFLANHTWSHPNLLSLTSSEVTDQVRRNERFLLKTYGVTGRPFLRPPYGYHDKALDAQLSDLGYPTVTMWLGTLGDDQIITPDAVMKNARMWIRAQHLVIGHANHPAVLDVMDEIAQLIKDRHLQPVHLGDLYKIA